MSLPKSETGKFSPENRPLAHMSTEQEETLKTELGELNREHLAGIAEQEYSALFLPLGILRTLKEGTFSEDERKHILKACKTTINEFFGVHTDLFFTKKMWKDAMQDPSATNIETCIQAIAKNIRAWAEFCRKYADIQKIDAESAERTEEDDIQDPLYYFIHNQESMDIAERLEIPDPNLPMDPTVHYFYTIKNAQRLAVLVEKLAPRIENGEIEMDLDISEIREAIARAKESLVHAIQQRDNKRELTGIPKMDAKNIDHEALKELEKIAQALKGQKAVIG